MLSFLRTLFRRDPPLVRTRSTGRPRTYSAESGYVYEYAFSGFRRVRKAGEQYIEYVFDVTGGQQPRSMLAILLAEQRLAEWTGTGRELTASERYGMAKLCLKRAMDAAPDPKSLKQQFLASPHDVAEIASELDL